MERPIGVPRILSISWWWLCVAFVIEAWLRYHFHWKPFDLFSINNVWIYIQAIWLKRAEPKSRAIYWYAASDLLYIGLRLAEHGTRIPGWLDHTILFAALALSLTAIFTFMWEMERHFNETDPVGLKLSGIMTFFFNTLYFQYHLHKIYLLKHREQMSITPAAA